MTVIPIVNFLEIIVASSKDIKVSNSNEVSTSQSIERI